MTLLSPFTDTGKAQREQHSEGGESSPADSDVGPSALPLPWPELEGSLGLAWKGSWCPLPSSWEGSAWSFIFSPGFCELHAAVMVCSGLFSIRL